MHTVMYTIIYRSLECKCFTYKFTYVNVIFNIYLHREASVKTGVIKSDTKKAF